MAPPGIRGLRRSKPLSVVEDTMANIRTIDPQQARGLRKLFFRWARRQYGGVVPGIHQLLAVDMWVAGPAGALYNHLHLRRSSPLSRLQREMVATVVNGKVGGAP
jgi:hypothetical protein